MLQLQRCRTTLSSRLGCHYRCYRRHPAHILSASPALAVHFRYDGGDNVRNNENRIINNSHSQRLNSTSSNKTTGSHSNSSSNSNSNSNSTKSILPNSLSSLNLKYMEEDELRQRFDAYDTNSDGSIDAQEAIQLVKDADGHDNSNIDQKNCAELRSCAEHIIESMDTTNNNQRVEWKDFKAAVDRAATPVSSRVYPISGTMMINFTGQGVQVPVVPFLARAVGLSTSELGMITASSALARIVSNVPAALAAEKFGRRPMLMLGPMLGATGMLGFALAPTDSYAFASFCAANTLCGFGSAITMAGCGLYLTDISTPLNRARTMAPLTMAALIGFMIGPPIGGFVADAYGLQVPFFITSGALILTAVSAMVFLPETMRNKQHHNSNNATINNTNQQQATDDDGSKQKSAPEGETSTWDHWRTMLRKPDIQGISSASFVTGMTQGSYAVTTIMYMSETLQMSTTGVGVVFTAAVLSMAAVTKPATEFSDRYVRIKANCRSTLIVPGLGIAALATGMRGLEIFPEVLPFSALFVVSMLANAALVTPNMTPFLVDATTEEQRPQALAMRNMAQDIGVLSGAITLGAVSQAVGVPEAILCSAGLQALTMLYFAARTNPGRRRKKSLSERTEQRQDKKQ
mmetsp:Transcript_8370/g.14666  ORF Transcript_8370/g.14666 Transcript_8370/m.14666 type:complete len:633 (+) Transcript_8370:28-1926(+)